MTLDRAEEDLDPDLQDEIEEFEEIPGHETDAWLKSKGDESE